MSSNNTTIYIAGPMTGIPEFNAPAFKEAAELWRAKGWDVVSPVEWDEEGGDTYEAERTSGHWVSERRREYMRRDIELLMSGRVQAIYMLTGWELSEGAQMELAVARAFGLIIEYQTPRMKLINYAPPHFPQGIKYDQDKLPWHLLPYDALEQVTTVLQYGAKKYEPRNWEKGMQWHRPFRAAINHLQAWWNRHESDAESGLSHLAHAACCALFLLTYAHRNIGEDDRPEGMERKDG